MEPKPVITIENAGNKTQVSVLGVDISRALTNVSYRTATLKNAITLDVDIVSLIDVLCEITSDDMKNAQEILAPYKESRAEFKKLIS